MVKPMGSPRVVDPTGAGDSFNGAYLAARIAGNTPGEAAKAAHRVAGIVIGHKGALVDPALVRHHAGMATVLVLPVFGDATVTRTRCSLDTAQPGLLITSVEFRWTEAQDKVARWLLEHDGLLPAEEDQQ